MTEIRQEVALLRTAITAQAEALQTAREELTLSREEILEQRQLIAAQHATLELMRQTRRDAFEHAPLILRRLTEIERMLGGDGHDLHRPPRVSRRRPLGLDPRQ